MMEKIKVKTIRCPKCNSAKTYMRIKKSFGITCYNCGKFTPIPKEGEKHEENITSSDNKCPSCGGIIKNGECQSCHARKFQEMFVFDKKFLEEKEEDKQKKQKRKLKTYVCECGKEVRVRGNVRRSWWDSIEWVICPACGERKRKEEIK